MIGYRALFVPERGGACPVIVVGVEQPGLFIVWKMIHNVVIERVVRSSDLFEIGDADDN